MAEFYEDEKNPMEQKSVSRNSNIDGPKLRSSEANKVVYTRRNKLKSKREVAAVVSQKAEEQPTMVNEHFNTGNFVMDSSVKQMVCEKAEGLDRPLKQNGGEKRTRKRVPLSSGSSSVSRTSKTSRDHTMHKLAFDSLPEGIKLTYYPKRPSKPGQLVFHGLKEGSGIRCSCCNKKISPSQFEAHAKYSERRKPYMHIYTPNGMSLHDLSISLNGRESSKNIACVLCREHDYCTSHFGPRTAIICNQCEKEYHVGCLKKQHDMDDLKEIPEGNWFCSGDCKTMYTTLRNLVDVGEHKIPKFCLDDKKKTHAVETSFVDAKWRLLSGAVKSEETEILLSQARDVFRNRFKHITDAGNRGDLIKSLVYGEKKKDQDLSGMYCAVLIIDSKVASAGIFRVLGREVAELPLAATHKGYEHKGCFTVLFDCIEKLLALLNVENLVLPAAKEAEAMWTEKFGFEKIPELKLSEYNEIHWKMIKFDGTSMLGKTVPK